jgi:crossover junction endodeoxyribonuclease RuvC
LGTRDVSQGRQQRRSTSASIGSPTESPNSPPPQTQRILGIDPGLNTTGYGVIEVARGSSNRSNLAKVRLIEAGIVRSRAGTNIESRLNEIYTGVCEIIDSFRPELLALEQIFSHYERPRTAILMGHARGVICLAAGRAGIDVVHYEPTRIKKVMTGNGRAPKHQIQLAVKVQLGLTSIPEPADVADALAIALCGHHLGKQSPIDKLTASG